MTRKDYTALASIVGNTLAVATSCGGEDFRTAIYDSLYRPLVAECQRENPRFDNLRFAAAVGHAETVKGADLL
jgi:hypothetical protein